MLEQSSFIYHLLCKWLWRKGQNSCFIENATIEELPLLPDQNSQVIWWETKQKTSSGPLNNARFPSNVYSRLQVTLFFDISSQKWAGFISSQLLPTVTVHSHLLQPDTRSTLNLPEIQNRCQNLQGYFSEKRVMLPRVFHAALLTSHLNTSTTFELQFKYIVLSAHFKVHN